MKKAKIMLASIALFAVIGGALAFKANTKSGQITIYTYTSSVTTVTDPNHGLSGCLVTVVLPGLTTANPTKTIPGFSTTVLTNDVDFCTISVADLEGE